MFHAKNISEISYVRHIRLQCAQPGFKITSTTQTPNKFENRNHIHKNLSKLKLAEKNKSIQVSPEKQDPLEK